MLKMRKIESSFFSWFKNRFLAGILALVPLLVTLWLAGFLYVKLTSWAVKIVEHFVPQFENPFWIQQGIRLATIILIIVILLVAGEFMRHKLGRLVGRLTDWILLRVPILSSIYSTTRQISEALWTPKGNMFRKVVLIEYPRRGIYTIGFLTNENNAEWELAQKTGKDLLSVFVPTTPNPTSGFLLYLPREDCIFLDMKVSEGMKLVISGGVGTNIPK
jgi:uncharacterized membrane protein